MEGERRGDSATTRREGREERREREEGRGKGDGGAAIGKAEKRK